jgi:hypothetical protein
MTIDLRRIAAAVTLSVLTCGTVPAHAQTVSDVLTFLVTNRSVQTDDLDRDLAAAQATSETISRVLLANLATLPVASSSSAFVYRLNPDLGTEERATATFAPFLVERALTAGRHQASLGIAFQHMYFRSLDGRTLRDGSLVTTANRFVDESAPFDVDRLTLGIDASIATLYGSLGVTDRLEIGMAVPTVNLNLNGTRVNQYRSQTFTQATASATTVGLADVVARAKLMVYDDGRTRAAVGSVIRFPTGRQRDLLGTGSTSLRLSAIGSFEGRRSSTHLNGGFAFGGIAREISYGGAQSVALSRQLTAGIELVGRWLDNTGEIVPSVAPHPRLLGVETIRLLPNQSSANFVSLVPGAKWNISDTWVLAANVTVPLRQAGLVSPITPFVGLDYTIEP